MCSTACRTATGPSSACRTAIGFRKLENIGGVQQINGVPVKYCGICRMEEFTPFGHALNEDCWKPTSSS